MSSLLPFLVIGITSGSVYGLAGVGLVLTYRTSGVFNFAHGALATAGAYLFYELWVQNSVPWPVALPVTVLVVGVTAGLLLELLARRLSRAPAAIIVVATVGLLLVIQGVASIRYGQETITIDPFLPTGTFTLSVNVGYDQLAIVLIGVGVSAGLAIMLGRTRIGVAMRGVVDDPELMELTGFAGNSVRRAAWIIGGSVAVLSGILIAPLAGLDPVRLTYLVVQAFGAAAIGRFRNLPATFAGGLLIGVVAAVGQKFAADYPPLLGFPSSVPFLALFVVLLVAGRRGLPIVAVRRMAPPERLVPLPAVARVGLLAALAVLVVLLPELVGPRLPLFTNAAGFTIMFLSLGLLVKSAAQVSLCHAAFVAVGAVAFSRLTQEAGLPWFLALLGAGLVTLPVGVLVALPAVRLSGIYLALATFAFGLLMENLVYRTALMFGQGDQRIAPRPALPGLGAATDTQYFYVAVLIAVAVVVLVTFLQRSRLGRLLRGLSDSPLALSTFGAGTTTTLMLLFAVSAFLAGVSGAVIASGTGAAGAGGLGSLQSLLWVAVISITGTSLVRSSVLASLLLVVSPAYLPDGYVDYQTVGFGVLAVGAALLAVSGADPVVRLRESLAVSARPRTRSRAQARVQEAPQRRAWSARHELAARGPSVSPQGERQPTAAALSGRSR